MAWNIHGLLHGTADTDGFHDNIGLPDTDESTLRQAREDIRKELRAGFHAISDSEPLRKAFLFDEGVRNVVADEALKKLRITPRFRMQGSFVYRTLNDPVPQHAPPQQIDLDDGVFLPTSFLSEERPVIAARGYFEAVQSALRPLCKRKKWTLEEKTSCVRVVVSGKIHIDLPLYAIPDEDFERVELMSKGARVVAMDEAILAEDEYQALPLDHIMLAESDGTWRRSDPRKLERWFLDAVEVHGEGLRRVCRYLKAWRDQQWREPVHGIPSITLMAIAKEAFDEAAPKPPGNRDDQALRMVADAMPSILRRKIANPVVEGETLDRGWTPETRNGFVTRARELAACLAAAQGSNSPETAIVRMQACLGTRVPDDVSLVETDAQSTQEARVLSSSRLYVPAQPVGRSVSG